MPNRVARCGSLMWTYAESSYASLVNTNTFLCWFHCLYFHVDLGLSRQCKITQSCFANKCILFFKIAFKMNNHYCSTALDYELGEL